jgi:transcription-repair coupling factor (superfamily II helicase)
LPTLTSCLIKVNTSLPSLKNDCARFMKLLNSGQDLILQLLASAIENLKAQRAGLAQPVPEKKLPAPGIDLPLPALIPADYVDDVITRLELYQRLADMTEINQVEPFLKELNDRFGPPPLEVNNLLFIVKIKVLGAKAGIESISAEDDGIVLRLFEGMRFDQQKIGLIDRYGIQTSGSQARFSMKQPGRSWQRTLEEILVKLAVQP